MKLKRIMDWIRSHKRQAIFIVIVLAVIFCIGIAVAVMLGIKGGSEELSGKAPEKTAVSAENEPVDSGTAIYSSAGTTQQTDASGAESTSSDSEAKEGQNQGAWRQFGNSDGFQRDRTSLLYGYSYRLGQYISFFQPRNLPAE